MRQKLSVIVPIYNDADCVAPFYERTVPVLQTLDLDWEIVFVNDASTDDSLRRIQDLRGKDPRVKVITFSRNFGYHAAHLAGIASVESDLYAMIHPDLEDPPELLAEFHKAVLGGAQTVYGIRSQREEPAWVVFCRGLFYRINKLIADGPIILWMAEFSMMTRHVRDAILNNRTTFPFLRAEMSYVGLRMVGVPYLRVKRPLGESHYSLWRMVQFAVGGFLASSTFPLRLCLYFAALLGAVFPLLWAGFRWTLAEASQAASIFTFFFVIATVPMIALYVARAYKNGVGRAVYHIDPASTSL